MNINWSTLQDHTHFTLHTINIEYAIPSVHWGLTPYSITITPRNYSYFLDTWVLLAGTSKKPDAATKGLIIH